MRAVTYLFEHIKYKGITLKLVVTLNQKEFPILNPTALRKAKIICNFGLSGCNRVKSSSFHVHYTGPKRLNISGQSMYLLSMSME